MNNLSLVALILFSTVQLSWAREAVILEKNRHLFVSLVYGEAQHDIKRSTVDCSTAFLFIINSGKE